MNSLRALLWLLFASAAGAATAEFSDGPLRASLTYSASTLRCGDLLTVTLVVESPATAQLTVTPSEPSTAALTLLEQSQGAPVWLGAERSATTWQWTFCAGLPETTAIPEWSVFSDTPQASQHLKTAAVPITITSTLDRVEPDEHLEPLAAARPLPGSSWWWWLIGVLAGALAVGLWRGRGRRAAPVAQRAPVPPARERLSVLLTAIEQRGHLTANDWVVLRELIATSAAPELAQQFETLRYASTTEVADFLAFGRAVLPQLAAGAP